MTLADTFIEQASPEVMYTLGRAKRALTLPRLPCRRWGWRAFPSSATRASAALVG